MKLTQPTKRSGGVPMEWEALTAIPTARQARFLRLFLATGCDFGEIDTLSRKAGYRNGDSRKQIIRALRFLGGNAVMQEAMARSNITIDRIAEKINGLLEAQKVGPYQGPDNLVQHKATETAIRLFNLNPPTRVRIDKHETHEYFLTSDVEERARRALEIEAIDVEPGTGPETENKRKLAVVQG